MKIDYPKPGPADIYALDVPHDAKVVKRLPPHEVEQLVEDRIAAQRALPKSYFSIECKLLESFEGDIPRLQPHLQKDTRLVYMREDNHEVKAAPGAVITVTYYKAPNARCEIYPIWLSESYSGQGQREQLREIMQAVPTDSVSSLEAWTKNRLPSQLIVFEKRRSGLFQLKQDGTLSSFSMGNDASRLVTFLNMDFWDLRTRWPQVSRDAQHLGQEPGPWGPLIGISVWDSKIKCYFNPARDYICERISIDSISDLEWSGHTRSVLEYAKTSAGRWYPRRTRICWDEASYLLVHYVDDTRRIDDKLFELDSISADDLAPLEPK